MDYKPSYYLDVSVLPRNMRKTHTELHRYTRLDGRNRNFPKTRVSRTLRQIDARHQYNFSRAYGGQGPDINDTSVRELAIPERFSRLI